MALPDSALAGMRRLQPVGLQLYTVRDLMKADFEGTLAAVAKLGYKEVEFAGYFGRTPDQVKDALKAAGLSAPSAHVPLPPGNSEWSGTMQDGGRDRAQVPGGAIGAEGTADHAGGLAAAGEAVQRAGRGERGSTGSGSPTTTTSTSSS